MWWFYSLAQYHHPFQPQDPARRARLWKVIFTAPSSEMGTQGGENRNKNKMLATQPHWTWFTKLKTKSRNPIQFHDELADRPPSTEYTVSTVVNSERVREIESRRNGQSPKEKIKTCSTKIPPPAVSRFLAAETFSPSPKIPWLGRSHTWVNYSDYSS